ncbi:MAG: helix-turn-helix domain-containing protein [Ferruginibacter sp.]
METILIPGEQEIKQWVAEALQDYFSSNGEFKKLIHQHPEPFLNPRQLAAILKISVNTLQNWRKRGLPFHKEKRRVLFIRSEVDEYVKSRKLQPLTSGL